MCSTRATSASSSIQEQGSVEQGSRDAGGIPGSSGESSLEETNKCSSTASGPPRRDRFGRPITSRSKNHSLCFADEVPGSDRQPLVCTVNVESFKAHNRIHSRPQPDGASKDVTTAIVKESMNQSMTSGTSIADSDSSPIRIKFYVCL
ncbi:hypothetical protein FOL47_008593 [Perkinsus chesapeaki]|uniref:Uncharacterized protein n=1 Tax=Perkinsus chesapeaki TaxID=330153 RepID=A0A7J6MTC2_PERCH|nr:hypothetical protein FOL47_008593 [Perkinsus chesapeaki]